jgi:hypothetical protein
MMMFLVPKYYGKANCFMTICKENINRSILLISFLAIIINTFFSFKKNYDFLVLLFIQIVQKSMNC